MPRGRRGEPPRPATVPARRRPGNPPFPPSGEPPPRRICAPTAGRRCPFAPRRPSAEARRARRPTARCDRRPEPPPGPPRTRTAPPRSRPPPGRRPAPGPASPGGPPAAASRRPVRDGRRRARPDRGGAGPARRAGSATHRSPGRRPVHRRSAPRSPIGRPRCRPDGRTGPACELPRAAAAGRAFRRAVPENCPWRYPAGRTSPRGRASPRIARFLGCAMRGAVRASTSDARLPPVCVP